MLGNGPAHLRQRADADIPLAPDEMTVAQLLQSAGYHTGLAGFWDLGGESSSGAPWRKGFDEFGGYLDPADANDFYADHIWSLPPNFSYDQSSGNWVAWDPSRGPHFAGKEMLYANTQGKTQYIPDLLTKVAMNFVKINQPDKANHYQPFFLLLNYEIPDGKIVVPTDAPFSEEAWPQQEKNRAALITRIDGYVGQLQAQLEKLGMTNNLAIFFAGASIPHKTAATDPAFFHSNIATHDFRVPMIVHWPGTVPAGRVSGYQWSAQDFLPTAVEIAYANSPTNLDGISAIPALLGNEGKRVISSPLESAH
jgi:arylsulfatase A-like enzyme